jgi:methylenetetrahydrofolate dehydrogenase (NADP+)/methenyltetrahydrofolate cyclohydrolase
MALYSNKAIKQDFKEYLRQQVTALPYQVTLVVYLIGNDAASLQYVQLKQKIGEKLGINVVIKHYQQPTYGEVKESLVRDIKDVLITGIIIQLPLEDQFKTLLQLLPKHKDVDLLNADNRSNTDLIAPTIQSTVLVLNDILHPDTTIEDKLSSTATFTQKTIVIIGQGTLVGRPATEFFERIGSKILIIDIQTPIPETIARQGDIVISGAGSPNLVNSKWLSSSAIVVDASTSDAHGVLTGDLDNEDTYTDTQIIVPSPGGIGPLTVLSLFYNLIQLTEDNHT